MDEMKVKRDNLKKILNGVTSLSRDIFDFSSDFAAGSSE